jgi:excisionase family DNA binding protein
MPQGSECAANPHGDTNLVFVRIILHRAESSRSLRGTACRVWELEQKVRRVAEIGFRRGEDDAMRSAADFAEAYRKADLRLRLLLFGDGTDIPPLVRGEASRQRVTNEIRHLRDAFEAMLETENEARTEIAEAASTLEEELRKIASLRAGTERDDATPTFVTPAEAAELLRMSPSSIYRAIRRGDIDAVRPTGAKRGPIRIPETEVHRLLESDGLSGARRAHRECDDPAAVELT